MSFRVSVPKNHHGDWPSPRQRDSTASQCVSLLLSLADDSSSAALPLSRCTRNRTSPAQAKWEKRKAELIEEIQQLEHQSTEVETQMKATSHHLKWSEMPEPDKFRRLAPSRKQLVDTVRMIAYRAETAMASVVREAMARGDDARSLLRDLFRSEADLLPDLEQQIMRVHVHPMSNPRSNRAIAHLLQHLNDAEFTYPGTNLRLLYSIVGAVDSANPVATQIPPGPEV